jgi:hypothetical protein
MDDGDMEYTLELAKSVLSRTPGSLTALLSGLPEEWTASNEGPETWSPYQVVGHLVHIEESDWIDRTIKILAEDGPRDLDPVDREAGFERFKDWPLSTLLDHFTSTRTSNLVRLDELVTVDDLNRTGIHASFGEVTLRQLLAAWVVHDFNHFNQIVKTMAKQYAGAIGPWREFLPIIDAS